MNGISDVKSVSTSPSTATSSNVLSIPNTDYRPQIVEVLARTMDGCLAEMGYHPNILQQVEAVNAWNARLREENAKLFQDNRKLAQLIGMQNERIAKPAAPPSTPPNSSNRDVIFELQSRIQMLEINRMDLMHNHDQAWSTEIAALRRELTQVRQMAIPHAAPSTHFRRPSSNKPVSQAVQNVLPGFFSVADHRPRAPPLPAINTSVAGYSVHWRRSSASARISPASSIQGPATSGFRTAPLTPAGDFMELDSHPELGPVPMQPPTNTGPNAAVIDLTVGDADEGQQEQNKPPLDDDSLADDFIQDCIDANFVEDEEDEDSGKLWCRMCQSRHLAGAIEDAPQPFVNASVEELVQHCECEHPKGWERLKQAVQARTDSD